MLIPVARSGRSGENLEHGGTRCNWRGKGPGWHALMGSGLQQLAEQKYGREREGWGEGRGEVQLYGSVSSVLGCTVLVYNGSTDRRVQSVYCRGTVTEQRQ